MAVIDGDVAQRLAAQAAKIKGAREAAMRGGRGVGDESALRALMLGALILGVGVTLSFVPGAKALAAHRAAQPGVARHFDRHPIGHRGAGEKQAGSFGREAEERTHPVRDLALDFERNLIAAPDICVQAGGQHLRQHSDRTATALHPAHEAGVGISASERQNGAQEFLVDFRQRGGCLRQLLAKAGAHLFGNWLPDGAFADGFDEAQHVVEHAVSLLAEGGPVAGIE
jgi:hypothetical protein